MSDIRKVTEAFDTTYREMITELQKVNILSPDHVYAVPTSKEFYDAAIAFDLERYLVARDPQVFQFLTFRTINGNRVQFKKGIAFPDELYLYLNNLLLLATTLNSEVDFDRVQRNLQKITEAHMQNKTDDTTLGLMSIIDDVKSEMEGKVNPNQLNDIPMDIDLSNPAMIWNSLQSSGIDIVGIVNNVTQKLSSRIEKGEIKEDELQNMLMTLRQQAPEL